MKRSMFAVMLAFGFLIGPAATGARAGTFRRVALELARFGFELEGQRNRLSGGVDFRTFNTFRGNPLDFGSYDLTLQGPISFEVSTGGRVVNNLDIHFTTATNSLAPPQALNYIYNFDIGPQDTRVTGSILIDGDFSINGFGFYDLSLIYSSRQTVDNTGWFSNTTRDYDADIGPIDISGNIFMDIFAAALDPIFERAGTTNPFEAFSGRSRFDKAMQEQSDALRSNLLAASLDQSTITMSTDLTFVLDGDTFAVLPNQPMGSEAPAGPPLPIPEPATLLLAALGAAVLTARRFPKHRRQQLATGL